MLIIWKDEKRRNTDRPTPGPTVRTTSRCFKTFATLCSSRQPRVPQPERSGAPPSGRTRRSESTEERARGCGDSLRRARCRAPRLRGCKTAAPATLRRNISQPRRALTVRTKTQSESRTWRRYGAIYSRLRAASVSQIPAFTTRPKTPLTGRCWKN